MRARLRARWQRAAEWWTDRYYLVSMIHVPPISGGESPPPPVPVPGAIRAVMARRR